MSEYVEFTETPLQLVKNKRRTETLVAEIERKLGLYEESTRRILRGTQNDDELLGVFLRLRFD